ncbi:hypothetical protein [Bradyrhizobium elkanii]|uniref:hypothetical protein n=1 Tax=Bradyrhizobium elkanii TaxID=29448 RepID=UPI0004ADFB91|nr:hypothetical protein [Bradyrhizobium elkanii]
MTVIAHILSNRDIELIIRQDAMRIGGASRDRPENLSSRKSNLLATQRDELRGGISIGRLLEVVATYGALDLVQMLDEKIDRLYRLAAGPHGHPRRSCCQQGIKVTQRWENLFNFLFFWTWSRGPMRLTRGEEDFVLDYLT